MPSSRKRRRSGRPGRSTGGTRAKPARAPQGSLETAQGCRRSGGAALPAQQPCCRAGLPCCQRRAAGLPAQGCAVTGAQRAAGARRAAGAAVQGSPASAQVSLALRAVTVLSVRRVKGRGTRPAPNLAKQATPGAAAQGCRCRAGLPRRAAAQGCRAVALLPRRAAGKRAQGCRERPAGLPAAVRRAAMLPAQGCLAGSPESVQGCRGGSAGLPARQP